jgi:predicted dehydrogenase
MNFALLGDHPEGLEMARVLASLGRHRLLAYHGPAVGAEFLRRWGLSFQAHGDMEEVLADPQIEAVIVAGSLEERPGQLRRALQSERHVLCVHPADQTPDIAYEAAMIQGDAQVVLMPLLPYALHPGIARLADLMRNENILGSVRLVEMEREATESILIDEGQAKVGIPGWDLLRALGGEIAEVAGFAAGEHLSADQPALLAGSFASGCLFRAAFLPGQHESKLTLRVTGSYSRAELLFPDGWPGAARLHWQDESGALRTESMAEWNPWLPVAEAFEAAIAGQRESNAFQADTAAPTASTRSHGPLSWQAEVRALELDDAVRRSVERRRVSVLEYPEANEAVGFKGTMTLVGCGLIWIILILLILSRWFPWLGWVILPVLFFFLGLQILRWLVPSPEAKSDEPDK